jgi:tRNA(adenine34) deaminase
MCGGALYWSQLDKVVFGASDDKRGASSAGNLYHPKTTVVSGVMEGQCTELIKTFFKNKRT